MPAAALVLLLFAGAAQAALGDSVASVAADEVHMKATRRIRSTASYQVHEIQLASGTLVREYVSAEGVVFAVAWSGPLQPDLQQLLGSHFADYQAVARTKRARRGPVHVQQPGLVVHSGGHMRAFAGQAYLPQRLPAGVAIDEIK